MARTPASGPIPTTITNTIAHIMLGRLLVNDKNILVGINTDFGTKFFAANEENIIAPMKPKIVATKAIFNVSSIPV